MIFETPQTLCDEPAAALHQVVVLRFLHEEGYERLRGIGILGIVEDHQRIERMIFGWPTDRPDRMRGMIYVGGDWHIVRERLAVDVHAVTGQSDFTGKHRLVVG